MIPQKLYINFRTLQPFSKQASVKVDDPRVTETVNDIVRFLVTNKHKPDNSWISKFFQPIAALDTSKPIELKKMDLDLFEVSYYIK